MSPNRLRLSIALAALPAAVALTAPASAQTPDNVYPTYGVHSDAHADLCKFPNCTYKHDKADPLYPEYWTSNWNMYRVHRGFEIYGPPYDGKPPKPLIDDAVAKRMGKEGDYQTSHGTTYYDSTYKSRFGTGAMEEHYSKFCLPIFPIANNYTCSFISLGPVAFFVTYADRPKWMPPVCLFSPRNHPPERDFIKHLPFAPGDSAKIKGVDGYSFWVTQASGAIQQVGASPDRTSKEDVLFGYGFHREATLDRVDKSAPPYPHPQSFYFSGVPKIPPAPLPNAPIVSQNYTDFAMIKPDPKKTWAQVETLDPAKLPPCRLFTPPSPPAPPSPPGALKGEHTKIPTWGTIGQKP